MDIEKVPELVNNEREQRIFLSKTKYGINVLQYRKVLSQQIIKTYCGKKTAVHS